MELKRIKTLVLLLIIGLGGYLIASKFLLDSKSAVPEEFYDARSQSAVFAQSIVKFSEELLNNLGQIAEYDHEENHAEALTLVSQELNRNRMIRQEAVKLSVELERMGQALPRIKSNKAKIIATQSITYEISLINHLVAYNDYLFQLFEILKSKFVGETSGTNGRIQDLIDRINEEATEINDLNEKFNKSVTEFNEVVS